MGEATPLRRRICAGLALSTLACLAPVCLGEFINLDDPLYVNENPHVLGGLTWPNVQWAFSDSWVYAGFWIPVTWLSLQLDVTLFGIDRVWAFHLVNLLLHVFNVVLCFLVFERMTGALWRSALLAALFGLHPLRVESVAWITERKDMLSGAFLMLTLAAYVSHARRPSLFRYSLVFLFFACGIMSKPSIVTLPFVLLLLDYWPLQRFKTATALANGAPSFPRFGTAWLVLEKTPMFVVSLVNSAFTIYASIRIEQTPSLEAFPLLERIGVALSGYLSYLEKTLFPANLGVMYPRAEPSWLRVAAATLILATITVVVFRLRRRVPAMIVGWLWFLGVLFPVSGIAQAGPQAYADRFTYLPHVGLLLAVVWGCGELLVTLGVEPFRRIALAAVVLGLFGLLSLMQAFYWRDSETLFLHTLSVTDKNFELHIALGGHYLSQSDSRKAEAHFSNALKLAPDDYRSHRGAGLASLHLGNYEDAFSHFERMRMNHPTDPDAHYGLGMALAKLGRLQESKKHLHDAIAFFEGNANKRVGMGNIDTRRALPHEALGDIALREGDLASALKSFEAAIAIQPRLADAHAGLGIAYFRLGRFEEAERELMQAVQLAPNSPPSLAYLASTYGKRGQTGAARQAYAALLERFPDYIEKTSSFVTKLVTAPPMLDITRASELALHICEATDFQEPRSLNALAATQAASGHFELALETARKARSFANDPAMIHELQARIELYSRKKALPLTSGKN